MSSTYGENLHLTIFGQSHSPAIGVTVEGIPAGEKVDLDELQRFLSRRAPGKNVWSTPRKEADAPEILSGLGERLYLRRAAHGHHPQYEHTLAGLRESCRYAGAPVTRTTPPRSNTAAIRTARAADTFPAA